MKNYRALVPIILVLLMGASLYSMVSEATDKQQEVDELIAKAEQCASQQLYDKAASIYLEVIEIDKDIKYYLAIADMYYDAGKLMDSEECCEEILDEFPAESEGYERAIRAYVEQEKYSYAYETLSVFDGRNLTSEIVEDYRRDMEFVHYVDSVSFDDVSQSSGDYIGYYRKGSWGFGTVLGKKKVTPQFEKIGYYANEIVAVCDTSDIWYFMGSDGEYLYNISDSIKGTISDVGLYNMNLFPVCVDGIYSYYNLEFEQVFGSYEYAGSFNNGVAAVKSNGKWQIINEKGSLVTKKEYEDIILDDRGICCSNNRIFVKVNEDEYIMLDNECNQIGTETFEYACLFNGDGYAAMMRGDLWGFVNVDGITVIEPKYQDAKSFSMKLAAVCDDDLWGYIDADGNEIIELQYSECMTFSSRGTAYVRQQEEWNLLKLYKYNY